MGIRHIWMVCHLCLRAMKCSAPFIFLFTSTPFLQLLELHVSNIPLSFQRPFHFLFLLAPFLFRPDKYNNVINDILTFNWCNQSTNVWVNFYVEKQEPIFISQFEHVDKCVVKGNISLSQSFFCFRLNNFFVDHL